MTGSACLVLGIDIGTTSIKAGVVADDGRELSTSAVPTPWREVSTGADIDPEELFLAALRAAEQAIDTAPGPVAGVGVASIAETLVLVDTGGQAIGRSPAWFDRRASDDQADYERDLGRAAIGAVTGLGGGRIPAVATLRHRLRHEPATRAAAHALSAAEWVAFRLGGGLFAEPSLATRTGAFDVARRQWWDEALAWAGAPAGLFPATRNAGAVFGRVAARTATLRGLAGAEVTVAGHDHLCAAVGLGATTPDCAADSCGTAEAVVRAMPADPARALDMGLALGITAGCHALPGDDALIGGVSLGLELTGVLELLGVTDADTTAALDAAALAFAGDYEPAGPPPRPAEPAEQGLAAARQALAAGEPPAKVWCDALARAAGRSRALVESIERLGGPLAEVRLGGGWARNDLLRHLKASCFPPLKAPQVGEPGVRGAALFAGIAADRFRAPQDFPPAAEEATTRNGAALVGEGA